ALLREAWYRVQSGQWQVTTGLQIFDWSVTDTISPSDLLNPRDWRDVTRPRKQPLPALAIRREGEHGFEWVLSPGGRSAQLPQGAWQQPLPAGLSLADPVYAKSHMQTALRYTHQWAGTDLSAVAYRGHAYSPTTRLSFDSKGHTYLQPTHDRLDTLSFGATRQIAAGSIARAELARFRQQGSASFVQAVLSIDHEFSGMLNKQDSLYALLQWQADRNMGQAPATLPGSYDFRRLFNRQFLTRLQYKPNDSERWQFNLEASLDPKGQQGFMRSSVKHRVNDQLEAEFGWLHLHGSTGSFWGQYAANKRLSFSLNWKS
ncbi:MAG: hypothetical protein HC858_12065, partial [Brachymonas sp.]|nr:hypothetical protein [Brachymonas sp.]